MERSEEQGVYRFFFTLGLIVLALVVIGAVVFMALRPLQLEFERETNQNSQQFVQTMQTTLLDYHSEYMELETKIAESSDRPELVGQYEAQQCSILKKMRTDAQLIDESEVPRDIVQFLAAHKNDCY